MNQKDNAIRMRKLVGDFRNSYMSFNKFAEAHGISRGKLHYWVRRFGSSIELDAVGESGKFIPLDLPLSNSQELRYIIINKPWDSDQNSIIDVCSWNYPKVLSL